MIIHYFKKYVKINNNIIINNNGVRYQSINQKKSNNVIIKLLKCK